MRSDDIELEAQEDTTVSPSGRGDRDVSVREPTRSALAQLSLGLLLSGLMRSSA